jgi:hypothetical protein
MTYYINSGGFIIDAEKWDGSIEGTNKIVDKFGVKFFSEKTLSIFKERYVKRQYIAHKDGTKLYFSKGCYFLRQPIDNNLTVWRGKFLEKYFKPVADDRIKIIQQLQNEIMAKLNL